MAGETRTITIVADLNTAALAANDEFAIELVEVAASADVEVQGSLQANTMRIGSVDAPEITITGGSSVSDPKLGEKGADIFEFEIEGANDEDVVLKSITFEGDSDAEDNLMNFELYMGNNLVASTEAMNDDYLTFNLGDGITIEEDKNEDFTVKADVVEGATDTIQFRIDQALDVTAESTKFGFGAAVDITDADAFGDFDGITIEAGELTIVEIEPDFDEVREDKDNVVLGGIKVTNVAGQNLELQEFGVRIVATNAGGAFVDNGAGGGTAGNDVLDGTEGLNVIDIFDDVELYSVDTGSSYELTSTTAGLDAVFSENSIDVLLPEGTTEWEIRADTADDIFMFDDVSFTLSFVTGTIGANGGFYVEETEDDEAVNDITPSSITFNSLDGSESGAQVSLNNLADLTVVRGADDVVALQFEIEAEESSDIVVDEVTVNVQSTVIGAATNQEIAEVKLYKGSVSESNLLDTESGSNIGATGDVTFDDV
jgi:hypothetical protein